MKLPKDVSVNGAPNIALTFFGVMEETDFQRWNTVVSQIYGLNKFPGFPGIKIKRSSVGFRVQNVVWMETLFENLRGSPFGRNQNVVVRLVPEIVPKSCFVTFGPATLM